jgi:UDP-N-acetylmuramoyl-tripeptide--D-alanyl-D-alanine ligase
VTALLAASIAVAAAGIASDYAGRVRRWLHIFQLEHYENWRLIGWWRRRLDLLHLLPSAAALVAFVGAAVSLAAGQREVSAGLLIVVGAASLAPARVEWLRPEKKPFVFTSRAKRLFAASLVPGLLFLGAAGGVAAAASTSAVAVGTLVGAGLLLVAATPIAIILANVALLPLQRRVNRRYVAQARAKLDQIKPLTVGITGSYGKTTTKFCAGAVLAVRGETLVTPDSYNSYLGVTRAVNEQLKPEHRVFVVEMGAYRKGDITELCELTKPTIGILTAIGPMHLERFGSVEAIREAKAELLGGLPNDGHFITNGDDPLCRLVAAAASTPVTLFGIDSTDADVRASDIRITSGKTFFTLHLHEREYAVESRLLGRHNVRNLIAAAACGIVAGVDDDGIVAALQTVEAPPHRLASIVNGRTGVIVIDDAYNSNPAGAAGALEVLAAHDATRRLLVTPGMVELGDQEEEANVEFGRMAGRVCDLVMLVGVDQTLPVKRGLLEAGLGDAQIVVTRDIEQATAELGRILRAGDVVLFENDLPDTYVTNGRARV